MHLQFVSVAHVHRPPALYLHSTNKIASRKSHTHTTVGEDIRFCNSRCWHNFFRSWFFGHQSIRSPKWFMSHVTMKMRDTKWLAIISKSHSVTMKNIKFLCTPFDGGGGGVCVDVNMCAFHFTAIIGWIHQGTCLTFERLSSVARIKIISFNSMLLRRMIASLPLRICRLGIVPKKHRSLCVYIPNIAHIFFFRHHEQDVTTYRKMVPRSLHGTVLLLSKWSDMDENIRWSKRSLHCDRIGNWIAGFTHRKRIESQQKMWMTTYSRAANVSGVLSSQFMSFIHEILVEAFE